MMFDELTVTGALEHNTDKRMPPIPDTKIKQVNLKGPKSCSKICPISNIDMLLHIKCSMLICKNREETNRQI
jgi:hypothetical protein